MNMHTDPAAMTEAVYQAARRPQAFHTETFDTFVIAESTLSRGKPLPIPGDATTLDDAIDHGLLCTPHKGVFEVRCTNHLTGAVMRRFYVVKRKAKGVARYSGYETRMVRDTYAEHLFDLVGGAL